MRLSLLTAAALLSVSVAAHAAVTYTVTPSTTTTPNGLMSTQAGVTTINFNGSMTVPGTFTGSGIIANGSATGSFAAPNGDTSNYFAVGGPPNYTGTATFTPGGSYNYFGLYWGSIDTYNTITFFSGATNLGAITGGMVPPSNGNQTAANTNEFVDVFLTAGQTYDRVVFTTTTANFELDNVAYGNVTAVTPEPSSLALLGTGLLGIAGVVKRRLA